ncbi:PE family protein [Mycobacterium sp. 663a-19]|nr:PE family protein [Mycobacterium sp. 663a-19]MEB3984429.1 PE family protein [Mycobacterium sp. 663a-19]
MSFVITRPEALATAAGHLDGVGSGPAAENVAAAEVSALTATQFSAHAAATHETFTSVLGASATSCAADEAANTT